MPKIVQLNNGTIIELEDKPFANGGEGELYKIIGPIEFHKQVVKIYNPEKRTKERENKIAHLAGNSPKFDATEGHCSVIWIDKLVYENNKFCGFTMPLASGIKLEFLCHYNLPKTLGTEWTKFDYKSPNSHELRIKLCFNIAVAIYHIHKLQNYVLVDLKPENIIVKPNGLISIIDIDSVAVVIRKNVTFPAPVATPEYTPPEFYKGIKPDAKELSDTWDRFSMAVIFYRLLCGIHPFTGTCHTPYEKCNTLTDMVKNGLFPHGIHNRSFKVIPEPHNKFLPLDKTIKDLFLKCFIDGHNQPTKRPSADDWCKALSPHQKIEVNRPLPSSFLKYPTHNYCKAITYNPSIILDQISEFAFLNPKPEKGLSNILNRLFGGNKIKLLIEKILIKENSLKNSIDNYKQFYPTLKQVIIDFERKQMEILGIEKTRVGNLKDVVLSQLSKIDNEAKLLWIKEENEINDLNKTFARSKMFQEQKISMLYAKFLGDKYESFEKNKYSLNLNLDKIYNKINIEITNLVSNPNKLSRFNIKNANISNFGSQTYKELEKMGIVSASDFIDTRVDGYIKNRLGKWIKVNGIGSSRANDLLLWKKIIELKEDEIINSEVKKKYKNELANAKNNIHELELNFGKFIKEHETEYNIAKQPIEDAIKQLSVDLRKKTFEISKNYDQLHLQLVEQCKDYLKSILPRLEAISTQTKNEVNKNFEIQIQLFVETKNIARKAKEEIELNIIELTLLHTAFKDFN